MKKRLNIGLFFLIIILIVIGNVFTVIAEPAESKPLLMAVPDKPNPVSPRGYDNFSRALSFYWDPAANADSYTVNWSSNGGDSGSLPLPASDPSCGGGWCAVSTTLPFEGEYQWYVTAINAEGSIQSDTLDFSLNSNISTPDAYSPSGTIYDSNFTTFVFTDVQDYVNEYRIRVIDAYSNQVVMDRYWNVDELSCENYRCSITTDTFIPSGNYIWRVRGYSETSASNWSNELAFYMYCSTCNYDSGSNGTAYTTGYTAPTTTAYITNTTPTPISPSGNIQDSVPTFTWRTLTGANLYWLAVYDSNGKVVYNGTTDSSVCNFESCTYSPGFTLPATGNYSWKVSGGSSTGVTWGSATAAFILAEPPKNASFISPAENGIIGTSGSSIVWADPGESIEVFKVVLYDSAGNVLLNTEMDRGTLWCDGSRCTLEFSSIPQAQAYRIEITPVSTYGAQGSTVSLTFNVSDQALNIEIVYPQNDTIVQSRPLFRWKIPNSGITSTEYMILVTDSEGNNAQIGPLTCDTGGLTCTESEAFFIPSDSLPAGTYTWIVNAAAINASSSPAMITVK
ncbi:MAG: hypothetical protein AB9907_18230 [Flexilinea sp.]